MPIVKLFEVTDTWYVKGRGLELVYDSPIAASLGARMLRDRVTIVQPDASREVFDAVIRTAHFSMDDGSGKFAFVVLLPQAAPGSIGRGSQVFGSEAAAALLQGDEP
jgi:hypothetical protein